MERPPANHDGDRVTSTYDATYQILSERRSGPNAYAHTFTYDAAGNRLVKNEGGSPTTYSYDAADRLVYALEVGGRTTYAFDADGNQRTVLCVFPASVHEPFCGILVSFRQACMNRFGGFSILAAFAFWEAGHGWKEASRGAAGVGTGP